MIKIPFTKAHGAQNDFLLTWSDQAPADGLEDLARQICERHTGVGADGWLLMKRRDSGAEEHVAITLYNSDGSRSEMSGNGTRCVAALMVHSGIATGPEVRIRTGAGLKYLRVTSAAGNLFEFEMGMGSAHYNDKDIRRSLIANGQTFDAAVLNVGNPQCAVFVDGFGWDWRSAGAAIERHEWFPQRTNVSFVRAVDRHTIDVRFWERGAGETMSSGTGSTGAAFAAVLRGIAESPVNILTPAGPLHFRLQADEGYLTGPAELIGVGEFHARRIE